MKIIIIGPGPLSTFLAARFALYTKHEIFLLDRGSDIQIDRNEITVKEVETNKIYQTNKIKLCNDINLLPQAEVIILAARTSQNSSLIQSLSKVCLTETSIILLQNGLEFEKGIEDILPHHRIYSGACWIKITAMAASYLHHEFGNIVKLGRYSSNSPEVSIDHKDIRIKNILEEAGIKIDLITNIKSVQLTKLALNVPLFILSSLKRKNYPEILNNNILDKERKTLQEEIILAAYKINSPVDVYLVEKMISKLKKIPIVPPNCRIEFAESMKKELPLNIDPLLRLMKKHNLVLKTLEKYKGLIYSAT